MQNGAQLAHMQMHCNDAAPGSNLQGITHLRLRSDQERAGEQRRIQCPLVHAAPPPGLVLAPFATSHLHDTHMIITVALSGCRVHEEGQAGSSVIPLSPAGTTPLQTTCLLPTCLQWRLLWRTHETRG